MADFEAVNPDEGDNIWVACTDGDIERVKHLITIVGLSVNAQDENGFSPLHAASSYNELATMQYLLSVGADVNLQDPEGDTPLLVCETPEAYELLIAAGADPATTNTQGQGIFDIGVEEGHEALVNYLVAKGIGGSAEFRFSSFERIEEEDEEEESEDDTAEDAMEESCP